MNNLKTVQRNGPRTSPLVVMGERYNIDPTKMLSILKATVIKGRNREATNEEVAAFAVVCNEYGLNPFLRHIHAFTGQGGQIVPIVSVDGWASIVNKHPEFDGCEFVEENDREGHPLKVTCKMFAKGRGHPVSVTEWFSECYRETEPWKKMPRRMLRHKAFIQAARYCFGLTGVFDEDEGRDIVEINTAPPTSAQVEVRQEIVDPLLASDDPPREAGVEPPDEPPTVTPRPRMKPSTAHARLRAEIDRTAYEAAHVAQRHGKQELTSLTQEQITESLEWLSTCPDAGEMG